MITGERVAMKSYELVEVSLSKKEWDRVVEILKEHATMMEMYVINEESDNELLGNIQNESRYLAQMIQTGGRR